MPMLLHRNMLAGDLPLMTPILMRSVEVSSPGGPEVLRLVTIPVPQLANEEVLVRVQAAGVNRADLLQRQGHYPPPRDASHILGMEISGQIVAVGKGCTSRWRVGDAVCALVSGGGYAEYCAVPEGQCMPIPSGVSVHAAASIPEGAITVWANLFEKRRIFDGDRLLVQGGSSGVGVMAVQIARALGARVATTSSTEEKCKLCTSLGAEIAVNYKTERNGEDWVAQLTRWAAPRGFDAILDIVGGDYFAKHIGLLAPKGRLVQIAFLQGSMVSIDLRTLMAKRLVITGSTLRPRPVREKAALARSVESRIWPLFVSGQVRPVIDAFFPLERVVDAHRLMESGRHKGKIVLDVE
jgi:NADPH:quinone reductase